jgi:hypothetical protein
MLKMGNCKRCLLLPRTVLNEDELRESTKKFSDKYGLTIGTRPITLSLFENTWEAAKQVAGRTIRKRRELHHK